MSRRVVALVDNLMVRSRIEASARGEVEVLFPDTRDEATQQLDPLPDLILVDMVTTKLPWVELIRAARARAGDQPLPIVAFGPHMDLELRDGALAAGADRVLANSAIMTALPGLLRGDPPK